MENAHLIGLSRQIALHRELEVVANNIANVEHHRLQGRRLGVRRISDAGCASRAISGRRSAPELRAGPRDLARFQAGAGPADRQSARRRHRRRRLPGGADAARRALHAQRRAADQCHRPARDQRGLRGAERRRPDPASRIPTPISSISRRRHDQGARKRRLPSPTSCAASCGWSASIRSHDCRRTDRACSPHPPASTPQVPEAAEACASSRARSSNRTCAAWSRCRA